MNFSNIFVELGWPCLVGHVTCSPALSTAVALALIQPDPAWELHTCKGAWADTTVARGTSLASMSFTALQMKLRKSILAKTCQQHLYVAIVTVLIVLLRTKFGFSQVQVKRAKETCKTRLQMNKNKARISPTEINVYPSYSKCVDIFI